MDSLGLYIPSPGHTGWDLEGAHKTVWAVGLGIFDPCKKGGLVQALPYIGPKIIYIYFSKFGMDVMYFFIPPKLSSYHSNKEQTNEKVLGNRHPPPQ